MSILRKLFDPFSQEEKTENGGSTISVTDVGILEETVKELILDAVIPFTGDDHHIGLTLWINDEIYHVVSKEAFIGSLRASFDSMRLPSLGSGEIRVVHGEPAPQDEASPLSRKDQIPSGKIWMRLQEKGEVALKHARAVLSIFRGQGSCKEDKYVLDAAEKKIYRIGRGEICRKPGEAFRLNDIVIEENNPDLQLQKLNNYVSAAHADILLENGSFFLKAMPSGCRMTGGSPTKIIRSDTPIELRDPLSACRLEDGDYIELGKSVLLLFKIID